MVIVFEVVDEAKTMKIVLWQKGCLWLPRGWRAAPSLENALS